MNTRTGRLSNFATACSDDRGASEAAPHPNHAEADASPRLYSAIESAATNQHWVDGHTPGNHPRATRYPQHNDEYAVQVDPMDELQCDSCQ